MKYGEEDLDLRTRKAVIARLLRSQADQGAIEPYDYLVMQGRIEAAKDREELDALQAEIEARGQAS